MNPIPEVPFVSLVGIERRPAASGSSLSVLAPRPELLNSLGVLHGGVLMTLMDVAMASAARSLQADMAVVTVELKTSFMRPARGTLQARGRVLHRSGTMAFTEATIFDASERAVAHATGTFKYVRRTSAPASGQAAAPSEI
jgi:uncharacterized protein (TIGR00369 family)